MFSLPLGYTEDGLETDLTSRRVTLALVVEVTITASQCSAGPNYLGVELLDPDGNPDAYACNDYAVVAMPPLVCDEGLCDCMASSPVFCAANCCKLLIFSSA